MVHFDNLQKSQTKKIEDSEQQTQKVAKTNLFFAYLLGASEAPQRLVEYGGMWRLISDSIQPLRNRLPSILLLVDRSKGTIMDYRIRHPTDLPHLTLKKNLTRKTSITYHHLFRDSVGIHDLCPRWVNIIIQLLLSLLRNIPPATFQPKRGAKNGELIGPKLPILFQTTYENDTVMIIRPFCLIMLSYWCNT